MKKYIGLILLLACLAGLVACDDLAEIEPTPSFAETENTPAVNQKYGSKIYTDEEIDDALEIAVECFNETFTTCTHLGTKYAGDAVLDRDYWKDYPAKHDADQVIVLISTFDVGSDGITMGLNPNSRYDNWSWILVRSNGGEWRLTDRGF